MGTVLKTGPDRPVEPGTGGVTGFLSLKNRLYYEPEKTAGFTETQKKPGWFNRN